MPPAPLPKDEAKRLEALHSLGILDSQPSAVFDAFVKAASLLCCTPIALISLVDENRQWFKASLGLNGVSETPRDLAFCAYSILSDDILEVSDATTDPRFSDNLLVRDDPHIRFYAGAPLRLTDGSRVGTLCVIDRVPHQLDDRQRQVLACLALAAAQALDQWRAEALLRKTAHELRMTQEFLERTGRLAGVGGWSLGLDSNELIWSAETYQIHGLAQDYVPTLNDALKFYTPEAQPKIAAAVESAKAFGTSYDLELPFIRADGAHQWVRAIGERVAEPDKPARLIGAFQDITVRHAEQLALTKAKERMAIATDSAHIGIWEWDVQADLMVWNDWMYRLYGLPIESGTVSSKLWKGSIHPKDRQAADHAMHDALKNITVFDTEFRITRTDDKICHIKATANTTFDSAGRAVRMVGAAWDVTKSRELAAELAEQHELRRVTLHSIGDGVITTDEQGRITWLNPVAERLTGWPASEAAGRPLSEVFVIFNEPATESAEIPVAGRLAYGKIENNPLLISRQGCEYGIEASNAPICNKAGETLGAVMVFHDVTEQRQLSGEMTYRATHDTLTGLLNRSEFDVRLRFMLHTAHSDNEQNALLFIDLDQFKLVNDTCGHAAGDDLLVLVAKILTDIVRPRDIVARLGGDEFAIMLARCPIEKAQIVAQRICDRMEDFRFTYLTQRFRVGASVGVVLIDQRWTSTAAIMQAADASCYAAKEAGRNRVHVWYDSDQAMRARQGETQWASRLAQALDDDDFVLFAQRIQKLGEDVAGESRGIHAEVLLRLPGHNGAVSLPGAFLPAAERFHMASRIDRRVLSKVIRWMNAAPSLECIDTLCVNLSGQSVGDAVFNRWAIASLSQAGSEICRRLCIEITETAAITHLADAAMFIRQIRQIGVRVGLDDFGAGASSFGYLKTMPVDFLKIDGQFVKDLTTDSLDEAAIRCFVDVAATVGMNTIAECVENADVLRKLRAMGVDFAQGFLVHKPAPIDELFENFSPYQSS